MLHIGGYDGICGVNFEATGVVLAVIDKVFVPPFNLVSC